MISVSHNVTHHSTSAPPQLFSFGAAIAATIAADSDAATLVSGAVWRSAVGEWLSERLSNPVCCSPGRNPKLDSTRRDCTHMTFTKDGGEGAKKLWRSLGLLILFFLSM